MNRLLHWLNGDLHDLLFSFITVFRLLADFFPNPNRWTERTGVFQLHGFSIKMQIAFERQCFPQHGTGSSGVHAQQGSDLQPAGKARSPPEQHGQPQQGFPCPDYPQGQTRRQKGRRGMAERITFPGESGRGQCSGALHLTTGSPFEFLATGQPLACVPRMCQT